MPRRHLPLANGSEARPVPEMTFPLVRDHAGDKTFPVPIAVTCRVLGFSRQSLLRLEQGSGQDRNLDDAHLTNAAIDVHADDPEFDCRFVADEHADDGHVASERRVWRLCSQARIFSAHSRRRGTAKRPGPPIHDDLGPTRLHRRGPEPVVAHRHHRAPHRRGQALLLREQGRLLHSHRGLLDRLRDEDPASRSTPVERGRSPRRRGRGDRVHGSLRPRQGHAAWRRASRTSRSNRSPRGSRSDASRSRIDRTRVIAVAERQD